jgi:hypothetical protein
MYAPFGFLGGKHAGLPIQKYSNKCDLVSDFPGAGPDQKKDHDPRKALG